LQIFAGFSAAELLEALVMIGAP